MGSEVRELSTLLKVSIHVLRYCLKNDDGGASLRETESLEDFAEIGGLQASRVLPGRARSFEDRGVLSESIMARFLVNREKSRLWFLDHRSRDWRVGLVVVINDDGAWCECKAPYHETDLGGELAELREDGIHDCGDER